MRRCLTEDVVRQIQTDVAIQQELEAEFDQLQQDRENVRAIFPTGDSKVRAIKTSVPPSRSIRATRAK